MDDPNNSSLLYLTPIAYMYALSRANGMEKTELTTEKNHFHVLIPSQIHLIFGVLYLPEIAKLGEPTYPNPTPKLTTTPPSP